MSRGTESNHAYLAVGVSRPPPTCSPAVWSPTGSTNPPTPAEPNSGRTTPSGRTSRRRRPAGPARAPPPARVTSSSGREPACGSCPARLHHAEDQRRRGRADHRRPRAAPPGGRVGDRRVRPASPSSPPRAANCTQPAESSTGIPDRLDEAEGSLSAAEHTVAALHADTTRNRDYLAGRSDIDAEIADIDDQLDHDLRIRTRVTRREQPVRVVTLLGSRPIHGQEARRWDRAAGDLAQHQAAFDVLDGVGPQPQYQHRSAYADSHARVTELLPPSERPSFDLSVEPPDLGLSL